MAFLNDLFTRLDAELDAYGVYKVRSRGWVMTSAMPRNATVGPETDHSEAITTLARFHPRLTPSHALPRPSLHHPFNLPRGAFARFRSR
jgi:hypothetical protein